MENGSSYVSKGTVSVIGIRQELPARKSKALPAAAANAAMNQAGTITHFPGSSLLCKRLCKSTVRFYTVFGGIFLEI